MMNRACARLGRQVLAIMTACLWSAAAWAQPSGIAPPLELVAGNVTDADIVRTEVDPETEKVTNIFEESIRLRWQYDVKPAAADNAPGLAGFELFRSPAGKGEFERVAEIPPAARKYIDNTVQVDAPYDYQLVAVGTDGSRSAAATTFGPAQATVSGWVKFQRDTSGLFMWNRAWLLVVHVIVCGAVIYFILQARRGRPMNIRKIAGLQAVEEAVGRATEMGRSVLFVPGIQDMNDIQTIAGVTILSRVAKVAAEYDAQVEVPTSRSLVMTAARETVQSAFLAAGRPDAYNEDKIYYVTDEQFGYVAYLTGHMVRNKPAACFYMGSFFAESLILAETGNAIGAIQLAGTAQPSQLPFFVAACDYTLIGEEFFAASAYLSGEPDQLGSLKGQDVGKILVGLFIVLGCVVATIVAIDHGAYGMLDMLDYLKEKMLV